MKAEQVSEDSRFEAELSNELGNEGFVLLAHVFSARKDDAVHRFEGSCVLMISQSSNRA